MRTATSPSIDALLHITVSTAVTIIPGLPGYHFRVGTYTIVRNDVGSTPITVTFSSSGGRIVSGPMTILSQGQGLSPPDSNWGWFGTDKGEGLVIQFSAIGDFGGNISGWFEI